MSFTDDDLKRLRDRTLPYESLALIGVKSDLLNALLARLEAAEKVCEEIERKPICHGLIEAWRKACGK